MVRLAKTKIHSNYFESYMTSLDLAVSVRFGKFRPAAKGRRLSLGAYAL